MEIIVEIYRDRMVLNHQGKQTSAIPTANFSTSRLLVGEFENAVSCLKEGIAKISPKSLFGRKPQLTVKPMELSDGGLCAVERRVLIELGEAAGGRSIEIKEQS